MDLSKLDLSQAIVCYAKCTPCQFQECPDEPHTWMESEDLDHENRHPSSPEEWDALTAERPCGCQPSSEASPEERNGDVVIMPNFRKKPVVVQALQWTGENRLDLRTFLNGDRIGGTLILDGESGVAIPTLEGTMLASAGDWIIRGVKGEYYPCKPDIFEATYEPEKP